MEQSGELPAGALAELAHLPLDDALDALGYIQRRKVLIALLAHNPQIDSPAVRASSENVVQTCDYLVATDDVHLSKLVELGFITWNRETHEVTQGPNYADITPLLQLLVNNPGELPDNWV